MASFFDGLESTREYVKKNFTYDPDTRLVNLSDKETVSVDSIPNIPEIGCKQVVLGTFELIAPYFYYNEINHTDTFILLASNHWTEHLNQEYVSCAFKLLLQNQPCEYPIRVLLPLNSKKLIKTNGSPRATLFELCVILQQSKRFEVYEYPLEGQSYGLYFMKHIPGTGGKRTRTNRRRTRRHQ